MVEDNPIRHRDYLRWWPIERQNMFTDAVFSIAATIAVANLNIKEDDLAMVCIVCMLCVRVMSVLCVYCVCVMCVLCVYCVCVCVCV